MQVLIADDNHESAETLAMLLQAWEYEPILAHDGSTALAILQGPKAPRLALLDFIMPGMNGIEICREIRTEASQPYAYAILVTGQTGREEMIAALRAGADDFLIKPVDANELNARLSTGRRIVDLQDHLLKTQGILNEQVTRDSLTRLWNRPAILEILERELIRSRREGRPLALIMADVDFFKQINDAYGHLIGDLVLREVGERLLTMLRPYDMAGRYGGEEFLIVLPGCGAESALALADRLRLGVATEPISHDHIFTHVTLSLGVAVSADGRSAQEILQRADAALYRAKRGGRNRVAMDLDRIGDAS